MTIRVIIPYLGLVPNADPFRVSIANYLRLAGQTSSEVLLLKGYAQGLYNLGIGIFHVVPWRAHKRSNLVTLS